MPGRQVPWVCVPGGTCPECVAARPHAEYSFDLFYFGLADDVIASTLYGVHMWGNVVELVPLPAYFFDGYTCTRVSIVASYLSYLKPW